MPVLHEMSGRLVDLRRHTNVHLYWRGRFGPTERYELWLQDTARCEHQFPIHTRTKPARRGIVNWSTGKSVNYLRVDPPPLWRLRDLLVPPVLLGALATWGGDLGWVLFLPATLLYFLIVPMIHGVIRIRHATAVGRALRDAQHAGRSPRTSVPRMLPD